MPIAQNDVAEVATKLGIPETAVKEMFLVGDTTTPEVAPIIESIKSGHFFTTDVLTTREANLRREASEEASRNAIGNTYGAMDKRVLEVTGIEKNKDEKTIDYIARAIQAKGGTPSEELQRLQNTLAQKDQALTVLQEKYDNRDKEYSKKEKQLLINQQLDIPINALSINVDDKFVPQQRKLLKTELLEKYNVELLDNGKMKFVDKVSGQERKNPTTLEYMQADELIKEFAPTVVPLKQQTSGKRGTGLPGPLDLNNTAGDALDFSQYSSQEAFAEDLKKQGIPTGSAKAGELYAAFQKARPDLFTKK